MALVAGALFGFAAYTAASTVISWMGGDPEGEAATEAATYQALQHGELNQPLNRLRQRQASGEEFGGAISNMSQDMVEDAREVGMGRRVTSSRDLLESVARRMGTTPERLGQQLSPIRMGDHSSVSRAAFGRGSKEMKK